MKRMFGLLLILLIGYFSLQLIFRFIDKGHTEEYNITTNGQVFSIKEIYTVNTDEDDNYYLEIKVNEDTFDMQIYDNLNMSKRIITDIYYYDADYKCILPVINKEKYGNVICKIDDTYYNYQDLKGKSESLDLFVKNLNIDEKEQQELANKNKITVYDNLIDKHYIALETYKGITTINKKNMSTIVDINLFEKDIYTKDISCFIDKYYLVADYNKQTKFNEFKLVDITNNKVKTIKYDYDISLDSYILGTYENKVYLFDNSTKKEYEIDVKKETIIEVGNTNIGIKILVNGNFENINAYTVYQNKTTFTPYEVSYTFNNQNYDLVLKVGKEKSGYYYIFEKVGNTYKVYRSNIQNKINKTYLFETNSTELLYSKDSVYYLDGKTLKRYDNQGNKIVLEYSELEFNNNIKIGLFNK